MGIIQFPGNTNVPRNVGKPAEVLEFCLGCKDCVNLVEVDDGVYICATRDKLDNKPIVPIVNDEKTSDWGFCGGEFYERDYRKASNGNRR